MKTAGRQSAVGSVDFSSSIRDEKKSPWLPSIRYSRDGSSAEKLSEIYSFVNETFFPTWTNGLSDRLSKRPFSIVLLYEANTHGNPYYSKKPCWKLKVGLFITHYLYWTLKKQLCTKYNFFMNPKSNQSSLSNSSLGSTHH